MTTLTEHKAIVATLAADNEIARVLASPTSSQWLKDALRAAIRRDCADACDDAALLARLLDNKLMAAVLGEM